MMYIMDVVKRLDENVEYKKIVGMYGIQEALTNLLPMQSIKTLSLNPYLNSYVYVDYEDSSTFENHPNNKGDDFVRPAYRVIVTEVSLSMEYEMIPTPVTLSKGSPKSKFEAYVLVEKMKRQKSRIDEYYYQIDSYPELLRVKEENKFAKEEIKAINCLLFGDLNAELNILK